MLSLSVIFTINCFFFDESLVHERYLNALNGKNNNISYLFKKEFKISIYTAIINNAIIMIFIKFIINWIFNITDKEIAMLDNSFEKGLSPKEKKNLKIQKDKFLNNYYRNIKIYFFLLFLINLFIAYICLFYGAVFSNSSSFFYFTFFANYIMIFIFCMFLCFIIIIIYIIWKKTNNLIAIAAYILLSRLY